MVILGITFIYLIAINVITVFAFAIDKKKSKKNKSRISEKTLIILMLIGGFFGGYFGMTSLHHKSNKAKFKIIKILSFFTFLILISFAVYLGFK